MTYRQLDADSFLACYLKQSQKKLNKSNQWSITHFEGLCLDYRIVSCNSTDKQGSSE
jgi:hypothetical protein